MHGALVDHWALLRAERADARSVKQPVRLQPRASDVGRALRYAWGSAPARRPTPTTMTADDQPEGVNSSCRQGVSFGCRLTAGPLLIPRGERLAGTDA